MTGRVEGMRHREPGALLRLDSGLEVPCPLGAIRFADDGRTVLCCDCGQEVERV